MKWQCALLQRWLPEYPDGDLPVWGQRWLKAHLVHCEACRQELAALREVAAALEAAPVADPGPEFWTGFSRELHLKLAQANQEAASTPPRSRWFRLPYLLGAPALAVLLLWVAVQLTGPGTPVPQQARLKPEAAPKTAATEMAAAPQRPAAPVRAPSPVMAVAPVMESYVPVSLENGANLRTDDDLDISGWDLDSELAGMTDREKEIFLHKLDQRQKDGSCIQGFFSSSWG